MGNKQPSHGSCQQCRLELCTSCRQCVNCYPIRNCDNCLLNNIRFIHLKVQYEQLKRIYDSGKIIKAKCYNTKASSTSVLRLWGTTFFHALLCLKVKVGNQQFNITLDCERIKYHGDYRIKVLFIQGTQQTNQQITQDIPINNYQFKSLYQYLKQNWHLSQYHRYTKNCYDFAIGCILKIQPNCSAAEIRKIQEDKAKQICKFWGH